MAKGNITTNVVKFGQKFIAGESTKVVCAEDLHSWLGIKTKFRFWIDRRISDYSFLDNDDYLLVNESVKATGRPKKSYWLTIDMAKELSMLEKNEKGREARKYFLACEKAAKEALKQSHQLSIVQDVSVKKAQIVVYYGNGDIENLPFNEGNVNFACHHLMPESAIINKQVVSDALLPIQKSMAAGLSLWTDIGETLKGREVLS